MQSSTRTSRYAPSTSHRTCITSCLSSSRIPCELWWRSIKMQTQFRHWRSRSWRARRIFLWRSQVSSSALIYHPLLSDISLSLFVDLGGGIPRSQVDHLFKYMYTTAPKPSKSDVHTVPLAGKLFRRDFKLQLTAFILSIRRKKVQGQSLNQISTLSILRVCSNFFMLFLFSCFLFFCYTIKSLLRVSLFSCFVWPREPYLLFLETPLVTSF